MRLSVQSSLHPSYSQIFISLSLFPPLSFALSLSQSHTLSLFYTPNHALSLLLMQSHSLSVTHAITLSILHTLPRSLFHPLYDKCNNQKVLTIYPSGLVVLDANWWLAARMVSECRIWQLVLAPKSYFKAFAYYVWRALQWPAAWFSFLQLFSLAFI